MPQHQHPPAEETNALHAGTATSRSAVEPLLRAAQVAELLAVPESWVREATRAHRIPYLKLGRYRRYQASAIEAWLQDQQAGPGAARDRGGRR